MNGVSWIPHIDSEFAGYRLVSLLGHGGMSIVYRAEHVHLGRIVALKLLSPDLSTDEQFRERFNRESRVAAGLDHPNIIPIFEAGEENGTLYIAMRYVDGPDLKTLLKTQGPLDTAQAISLVAQVASALDAAHAKGLIHRDVKPANILIASGVGLEGADHVYLADFGVVKNSAGGGLTKTGMFVGTADYASTEQIEGKQLDARADVYSLGCVLYEALTGARTYDRDSEAATMYAHLLEPPPKLTEKRPDLPGEIDEVIATALAKSRDDRYATAGALAVAVRKALATHVQAPIAAGRPGGQETVAATAPAVAVVEPAADPEPERAPPPPPGTKGPGRRNRVVLAGLGGLAVLVAAVLIPVLAFSDNDSDTKATSTDTTTTNEKPPLSSLLAAVAPTQISKTCTASAPTKGAVETNLCTPGEEAPTSDPNEFEFSFYPGARELEQAYQAAKSGVELGKCGTTTGEKVWIHVATGKRGGRRFCYTDDAGRSVIVWTHEKLGSRDHADMLGIAREPGRAPTIINWWGSVKDVIGKCRPKISEEECLTTILRVTGKLP